MRRSMLGMVGGLVIASFIGLGLGAEHVAAQPSATPAGTSQSSRADFERLQGFSTIVINHVNDVLGTEQLPVADGGGLEPGMFVTATLEQVQIYDHAVAPLQQGRLADSTIAAECDSGCPAAFYDAFQRTWLESAVESSAFAVEIPARVLLAVHRDLPASTLLQIAYAASETRPVQPPQLSLLVNNTRGSLRAKTFFLVPPRGLELRQGSAALGLTIRVGGGTVHVSATDPRFAREHQVDSPAKLQVLLREIKKSYPGKETVIVVPEEGATVGDVMQVVTTVGSAFPRLVLSGGQEVRTP
ncbi:hypothetical protein [Paraliomyxa miuraensis]|uniref:hypothetical protein n=1 Tax=Paraliomyxa miuraensis TaxID=376150 RepID=UPI002250CF7E|nr:hypothetical protein [Paraliomyxa miuraensis]MCX4243702.1 hypothetical protein [Paraliomyxa miuraensis]